jgi:hypothetical protein
MKKYKINKKEGQLSPNPFKKDERGPLSLLWIISGFILLLWLVFQPALVPACSYTADLRGCCENIFPLISLYLPFFSAFCFISLSLRAILRNLGELEHAWNALLPGG